jgi:hypothetical protein
MQALRHGIDQFRIASAVIGHAFARPAGIALLPRRLFGALGSSIMAKFLTQCDQI